MALNQNERKWIEDHFTKLNDQITNVRVDIATLKVKAGIWGIIGGVIPVLISIALYFFVKG